MSFFKYTCLLLFVFFIIAGFLLVRFGGGIWGALLTPVSIASKVIGSEKLKQTDGRTNIVLLGIDSRAPGSSSTATYLTDTIIVISVGQSGTSTAVVSIPRDLWVPEINEKINALYVLSKDPVDNKPGSISHVKTKLEEILGMPIHYHALVGFNAFRDAVDAVGGVTVEIDESFSDDLYPVEGKENAMPESERYMTVRFNKGIQTLDGEKALQFARSRHSSNPREAGDFARARRQQKVIVALKDKILSSETLLNPAKIQDLYTAFEKNVQTDIQLSDALLFYSKMNSVEINNLQRIVLSDEPLDENRPGTGLLASPTQEERDSLYGGKYVLVPKAGNYDEIKSMIRKFLFCDSSTEGCK